MRWHTSPDSPWVIDDTLTKRAPRALRGPTIAWIAVLDGSIACFSSPGFPDQASSSAPSGRGLHVTHSTSMSRASCSRSLPGKCPLRDGKVQHPTWTHILHPTRTLASPTRSHGTTGTRGVQPGHPSVSKLAHILSRPALHCVPCMQPRQHARGEIVVP